MKLAIPNWLKTDPLVCHVPDKTIFEPQRKIVRPGGIPHLLDLTDRLYPLANCDRLDLRYLHGAVLISADGEPITMHCDRQLSDGNGQVIVFSNGIRKVGVRIPPSDEVRLAAESLAQMFDGEIIKGEK